VAYLNDLIALEDPVIMAAAAEYQDTMVFDDFADTLMRMGSRWILTLSVNDSMLLELLLSLQTDKALSEAESMSLQEMLYNGDPSLQEGFAEFVKNIHQESALQQFIYLLRRVAYIHSLASTSDEVPPPHRLGRPT